MIRIVFMGTAPYGQPLLEALADHPEVEVAAVISQPDRPGGRGQEVQSPPIAETARKLDLPLRQPENINESGPELLDELGPIDLGIVVAYGQILNPEVYEAPKHGTVNFHASLLPRWRGATPIRHTLMHGDGETGVTVFRVTDELDAGPIAHQVRTAVQPGETYQELYDRLAELNLVGLNLLLSDLRSGGLSSTEQDGEPTYAPRLESDAGRIDWARPSKEIVRHIRAFCPEPGGYTTFQGERVKVFQAQAIDARDPAEPGTTLSGDVGQLLVKTEDGALALEELQPAGSRRMSVQDFLAGYDVETGDRWGTESE